ncbi:hypothetical protein THAOC_22899, partial [Thalassiosira oceanica]
MTPAPAAKRTATFDVRTQRVTVLHAANQGRKGHKTCIRGRKRQTANEIDGVNTSYGIQAGDGPAASAPPPAAERPPRLRPVPSAGRPRADLLGNAAEYHTSQAAEFRTGSADSETPSAPAKRKPGSIAFGECEIHALSDLFHQFAKTDGGTNGSDGEGEGNVPYLSEDRVRLLLESIGERPSEATFRMLLDNVDSNRDGRVTLEEFLNAADLILGKSPARVVLVVGGPGSGKGALCERLAAECGAVHLSCGEMLREEVESGTPLGLEVAAIMERGELVSSATVTALMRRRMRAYPGQRILLDGFPRSIENARDFVELCGPPELALHLDCDDTVLLERILDRGEQSAEEARRAEEEGIEAVNVRADDNVFTAINRLRTYHKHHAPTMQWLKKMKVPVVELDCSGSKEDVWGHLSAIGRLMRPAVQVPQEALDAARSFSSSSSRKAKAPARGTWSGSREIVSLIGCFRW